MRAVRPRSVLGLRGALLLATLATVLLTAPAVAGTIGDANGDGQVNALDVIATTAAIGTVPTADTDCNGDGRIDPFDVQCVLGVIFTGAPPLTTVQSSPGDGASGIALTRETIIRFSNPLAPGETVTGADIFAERGGQSVPANVHLSPDRTTATLFYAAPLPASSRIRVHVVGDGLVDIFGQSVDADRNGQPGGTGTLEFETLSLATLPDTRVCGRVFASELAPGDSSSSVNVPLEGVTISVDGAASTLFAVTDAMGDYCLDPAPVGTFFVHVDGRTAVNGVPPGAYYPFVGKPFQSRAGETVNKPDIFLPLVTDGTLQPVSQVTNTEIELPPSVISDYPELAGTMVDVPADSLYADDGSRGGMVGIAPVPPDRIPGPLPEGLNLPIVITVQTDGPTNFDIPVPACFPNLPDPDSGQPLPAGAKSALWSFNHDSGRWEVVGPMTVSGDGQIICSDPGYGILAPGWHGSNQATPVRPPTQICKDSFTDQQIFDTFFDIGSTATSCLANVLGVRKIYRNALAFAGAMKSLYSNVQSYNQQVESGSNVGEARDALKIFNDLKKIATTILDQLKSTADPTDEVFVLLNCFEGGLGVIDNLCGRVVQQCPSGLNQSVCAVVTGATLGFKNVNTIIQNTDPDGVLQVVSTAVACTLVDTIAGFLGLVPPGIELLEGPTLPSLEGGLDPGDPLPQEVIDLLIELEIEADQVVREFEPVEAVYQAIAQFDRDLLDLADLLLTPPSQVTAYPGNAYYLLQVGPAELRGRTGFGGDLNEIVAAGTAYTLWVYDVFDERLGRATGVTAAAGFPTQLDFLDFDFGASPTDSDGDGLTDQEELVIGTSAVLADTDGDDIGDLAEIRQGTDPLDGLGGGSGIVGTTDTPGVAIDVCAANDLAAVADSGSGVALFNVFRGLNPVVVAQVDTTGLAQDVACAGRLVPVADGPGGLAVIDVSSPTEAAVLYQVQLGADANAVTAAAGIAYVGLASAQVVAVDLASGSILDRVVVSGQVKDVAIAGETLFALTKNTLYSYSIADGFPLTLLDSVATSGRSPEGLTGRNRLFVGGGQAWGTSFPGFDTFDVSNPSSMTQLGSAQDGGPNSFKQIVSSGGDFGVAAVGINPRLNSPHDVSIYDLSDPVNTTNFLAELTTPGLAYAVTVFGGRALVADGEAGLQVMNFLPFDTLGVPPTVVAMANFDLGAPGGPEAIEGSQLRITADADDDVQVRDVELLVDGALLARDESFPFEFRFPAPLIAEQPSFTFQLRAFDTGGNVGQTPEFTVELIQDTTPPTVIAINPTDGRTIGGVEAVTVFFSEELQPATVTIETFSLAEAGPDETLGTGDDVDATGTVDYRSDLRAAVMSLGGGLPFGAYRVTVTPGITDRSGNPLAGVYSADFEVREVSIVAEKGTPASPVEASANVEQVIVIEGVGLVEGQNVSFPTRSASGVAGQRSVPLVNVSVLGDSGEVTVPDDAETGIVQIPDGSSLFLQIVPTVDSISGCGPGQFCNIRGSGFIEGAITIRTGDEEVVDQGPGFNDGVDVLFSIRNNGRADITVPDDGSLPYEVITVGGRSGRSGDVTAIPTASATGTPVFDDQGSANVDQVVTLLGEGFAAGVTEVAMEAISHSGVPSIVTVTPDSVDPGGTFLTFTVPETARTGMTSVMGAGGGALLQVVPVVEAVNGGRGRFSTVNGSGFTEGFITFRAGSESVVDGGPEFNDGIDVLFGGGRSNGRLDVTVPAAGRLPYEVITEGGRSGRDGDLTDIPTVSATGTPDDPGAASANVEQSVTLLGSGYVDGVTKVLFEGMTAAGVPSILTVTPDSVAGDGNSLTLTVPAAARAAPIAVLNGGEGLLLQIVPVVESINGGAGAFSALFGSGFIEGFTTVRFGAEQVVDGGPDFDDGLDILFSGRDNGRINVTVPDAGTLPYEVITEGGSSGRVDDVTSIVGVAAVGVPASGGQASANVDQQITVNGNGFVGGVTEVAIEAITASGVRSIFAVTPDSVAGNGESLTFTVPSQARSGQLSIINGGSAVPLQVVPTLDSVSTTTPGMTAQILGSGLTEGFITVDFNGVQVIDGGPEFNDGVDCFFGNGRNNGACNVTVPGGGSAPVTAITEGGTSNPVSP